MIMRRHYFLYNAINFRIVNDLQALKAYPTPVGRVLATCSSPVHKFIPSFLHRFYPLSSQGSQQVHIILANSPLGFP
jgi:hypothetical protein